MSFIELKNVSYVYSENSPFRKVALDDINLNIELGEFIGLIGHTGSGKSTLVQHLNGLLRPSSGTVKVGDIIIDKNSKDLTAVRREVGLVFQYPEYQLFEETVSKDIAFGPTNLNLDQGEIDNRVQESMEAVGLSYEKFKDKSPFELSGGQKRRVAIAGVLAMKPKVLILDEPTAGLDPAGRDEILDEVVDIYNKSEVTIVLVSHSMEDIAKIANRILVMDKAKIIMDASPKEVFSREEELKEVGLGIPQITSFLRRLKKEGADVNCDCITMDEAKKAMLDYMRSLNV